MSIFDNARTNCCCPVCGHEFDEDEIKDEGNICPINHYDLQSFSKEELIGEYDDYWWVI